MPHLIVEYSAARLRRSCGLLCAWVLSLGALVTSNVQAQSVSAWELVYPTRFDWQIRTQRQRVAEDLVARVSLLSAVVPEQSAEQQRQLKEIADTLAALGDDATPRQRSRLYLSRAYQHRRLLDMLSDTLEALQCVQSSERIADEMYCWSQVSVLLMDEETIDVALGVLRAARMVPRDEDMPVKAQDPKIWYGEYGRGIVRHILKPYLQSLAEAENG